MLRLILVSLLLLVLICITVIVFNPAFGKRPDDQMKTQLAKSPQFNPTEGIFENRRSTVRKEMRERIKMLPMLKEFFSKGFDREPNQLLPEVKPNLEEFLKPSDHLKVIWFGHSTFLLNVDGKIILVDPVFHNAGPYSFLVKRFQAPVLTLEELPKIDYVVLSHDHYDHLDMKTMRFFAGHSGQFIVPLAVGSHLQAWGIAKDRIVELDWWQSQSAGGIDFVATPAQHFSGRDGIHEDQTLWASWVIRSSKHKIYFSGDSGYDVHFQEIGKRFGPFDIAFIETGQYNEKWKEVHMMPDESVQAFFDLKAKRFFPVHWGMFTLAFHTWYDPVTKLAQASKEKSIPLVTPKLGQMVELNSNYQNDLWWEKLR